MHASCSEMNFKQVHPYKTENQDGHKIISFVIIIHLTSKYFNHKSKEARSENNTKPDSYPQGMSFPPAPCWHKVYQHTSVWHEYLMQKKLSLYVIEHQTTISLLSPLSKNTLTLEQLACCYYRYLTSPLQFHNISRCRASLSASFKHFVQMLAYFDRHNYPRCARQSLFECFEITKCHECKCARQWFVIQLILTGDTFSEIIRKINLTGLLLSVMIRGRKKPILMLGQTDLQRANCYNYQPTSVNQTLGFQLSILPNFNSLQISGRNLEFPVF